ncbi:Interferon-induced GTP-binding protein Mx [Colletotrichum gloeosporioides]|uniref:Interferon-induced GTP-binding protein Mx n=1 Tax=Colletotrichum gloeosporioides TaxID=474922 RepID=A0A8H4FMT1_COLGL|nr:Interferon-induced GTP-binding protein Mx [Colletotrichum gloeosporioides]KAF3807860.1 Interferon-induced GTP-binding protein Mx [Colletotrichum gloeosporioides]
MAEVTLDPGALDELNSVETRALFDTTDKLSSLGIGRIVKLPQIIVVGDQSSGKSSVLEAISHVKFPVSSGLCTRFATELVLRNGSQRRVKATIQFHDELKPAREMRVNYDGREDIGKIIAAAKDHMGLTDSNRGFSKDILRLEVEGPNLYPLTLVDLPGIFHTATAKQSAEGRTTVMELVESYMAKKNSIILAVISASNELANQRVLEEAAKHDPARERTLGVITKPDLLHPGSPDELEYLQVVRGREAVHKLQLGWHVLRNLRDYGEPKADPDSRDAVERKFFESGSWASIPVIHRGIYALRKRLSHILHDHIKKRLPGVLEEIREKLAEHEAELVRLGQARSSAADMRAYLVDIAGKFERLVRDGIQGHYNDPFFGGFDGSDRKLRSHLRSFNRAIRHILLVQGSSEKIYPSPPGSTRRKGIPIHLQEFLDKHPYDLPMPKLITRSEMATQLERQAAANQGTEFPGYASTNLIVQLFQRQSKPWEAVARVHLEKVTAVVKAFVDEAFEHIAGPLGTCSTTSMILATCVDPFFDAREKILEIKLRELLRPLQEGYALPLDVDFQEAMSRGISHRGVEDVSDDSDDNNSDDNDSDDDNSDDDDSDGSRHSRADLPRRRNEFGTGRAVETMLTFYDMALRTFTDNLINLALESCLIQELPGILTPKAVNGMDDTRLAELAAESEEIRERRTQLQTDIKLLKQGLDQCRRYRFRGVTSEKVPLSSTLKDHGTFTIIPSAQHTKPTKSTQRETAVGLPTIVPIVQPIQGELSAESTPVKKTKAPVVKLPPPESYSKLATKAENISPTEKSGLFGSIRRKPDGTSNIFDQVSSQPHSNFVTTSGTSGLSFGMSGGFTFEKGLGTKRSTIPDEVAFGGLGKSSPGGSDIFGSQSNAVTTWSFDSGQKDAATVEGEKTAIWTA